MEQAILRLLHLSFGSLWVGAAFLMGIFLMPAMGEAGPAAGAVMGGMVKRKLPVWMSIFALVTILSGIRLFMIDSANSPGFMLSPTGLCLGLGAIFAIVAFALGMAVQKPTAERLGALSAEIKAAGAPPTPAQQEELKQLGMTMGKVAKRTAILVLHAAIFMAASRLAGQF